MTSVTNSGNPASAFSNDSRPISVDGSTSRPHGNSNPIVLTVDGRPLNITGRQLTDQDVRQQLVGLFGSSQQINVDDWQCVVDQPSDVHDFLLEQYQATPEVWEYQIAGRTSGFWNPPASCKFQLQRGCHQFLLAEFDRRGNTPFIVELDVGANNFIGGSDGLR